MLIRQLMISAAKAAMLQPAVYTRRADTIFSAMALSMSSSRRSRHCWMLSISRPASSATPPPCRLSARLWNRSAGLERRTASSWSCDRSSW